MLRRFLALLGVFLILSSAATPVAVAGVSTPGAQRQATACDYAAVRALPGVCERDARPLFPQGFEPAVKIDKAFYTAKMPRFGRGTWDLTPPATGPPKSDLGETRMGDVGRLGISDDARVQLAQVFVTPQNIATYLRRASVTSGPAPIFSADFTNGTDTPVSVGYTYTGGATKVSETAAGLEVGASGTGVPRVTTNGFLAEIASSEIAHPNYNVSSGWFNQHLASVASSTAITGPDGTTSNIYKVTEDNATGVFHALAWTDFSSGTNGWANTVEFRVHAGSAGRYIYASFVSDSSFGSNSDILTGLIDPSTCAPVDLHKVHIIQNETFTSRSIANGWCAIGLGYLMRATPGVMYVGLSPTTPTYETVDGTNGKGMPKYNGDNTSFFYVSRPMWTHTGYPPMPYSNTTGGALSSTSDVATRTVNYCAGSYSVNLQVKQTSQQAATGGALWSCSTLSPSASNAVEVLQDSLNRYYLQVASNAPDGTTTIVGSETLADVPTTTINGVTTAAPARTTTITVEHDATNNTYTLKVGGVIKGQGPVVEPAFGATQTESLGINAAQTWGANQYIQKISISASAPSFVPAFSTATCCNTNQATMISTAASPGISGSATQKYFHVIVYNGINDLSGPRGQGDNDYEFSNKVAALSGSPGGGRQCEIIAGTPAYGNCDNVESAGARPIRFPFNAANGLSGGEISVPSTYWNHFGRNIYVMSGDIAAGTFAIYWNGQNITAFATSSMAGTPDLNVSSGMTMATSDWPGGHLAGEVSEYVFSNKVSIACNGTADVIDLAGSHHPCFGSGAFPPDIAEKLSFGDRLLYSGANCENWLGGQPDLCLLHGSPAQAQTQFGSASASWIVGPSSVGQGAATVGGWSNANSNSVMYGTSIPLGASPDAPYARWRVTNSILIGAQAAAVLQPKSGSIAVNDTLLYTLDLSNDPAGTGSAASFSPACPTGFTASGATVFSGDARGDLLMCRRVADSSDLTVGTPFTITASKAGTTLTVTATGGAIKVGSTVYTSNGANNTTANDVVLKQLTGTAGSTGSYQMSNSDTVGSETMEVTTGYQATWTLGSGGTKTGTVKGGIAHLTNIGQKKAGGAWTFDGAATNFPSPGTTIPLPSFTVTGPNATLFSWASDRIDTGFLAGNYVPDASLTTLLFRVKAAGAPFSWMGQEMGVGAGSAPSRAISAFNADSQVSTLTTQYPKSGTQAFH